MHKDGKRIGRRIAKVTAAVLMLTAFGATGTADATRNTVTVVEDDGSESLPQLAGIRWR